ncbi:MAG: catechol 2,3-dioxygenase, partial [Baekduiaceae bacterium]
MLATEVAVRGRLLEDRAEHDESLDFFTRVYGLTLLGQSGDSAYLRAWDDYEFATLKLTR